MEMSWIWIGSIVLILSIIGLGFIVDYLACKVKQYQTPRVKIEPTERIKQLANLINDATLEERCLLIKMILGTCQIALSIDNHGIKIVGAGETTSQNDDTNTLEEYTG